MTGSKTRVADVAAAAGVKMKDFAASPKRRVTGSSEIGDAVYATATEGMSLKYVARYTGSREMKAL